MTKAEETLEAWKDTIPDWDQLCVVVQDLVNNEREAGRQEAIDEIRKIHPNI